MTSSDSSRFVDDLSASDKDGAHLRNRDRQQQQRGAADSSNPVTPVNFSVGTRAREETQDSSPTESPSQKRNRLYDQDGPTSNALHEDVAGLTHGVFHSPQEFIAVISEFLERRTSEDESVPSSQNELSAFYGISKPDMRPIDYVSRIFVYAYCSPSAFVIALILLLKAAEKHDELKWTVSNIHRLLLAGVIVGTKIVDDRLFTMSHYMRVGGVPTIREMLRLELIFLRSIDNEIGISENAFLEMLGELKKVRDDLRRIEDVSDSEEVSSQSASVPAPIIEDVSMTSEETNVDGGIGTMPISDVNTTSTSNARRRSGMFCPTSVVASSDETTAKHSNFHGSSSNCFTS